MILDLVDRYLANDISYYRTLNRESMKAHFFILFTLTFIGPTICQEYHPQIIIHFTHVPNDQHHHLQLSDVIIESLFDINKALEENGYIFPLFEQPDPRKSGYFWKNALYDLKNWYYSFFFKRYSLRYKGKLNRAFFTREDKDLGIYTMYIPEGVPYTLFVDYLKKIYLKKGVAFHIDEDLPVKITDSMQALEGVYLTLSEVDALQKDKNAPVDVHSLKLSDKKSLVSLVPVVRDSFMWHQRFPTVGLYNEQPVEYPFIPHQFSLWQLAPKKGAGITIAVIDTGVAAFALTGNALFKKNSNLNVSLQPGQHNFNIVSDYGLDPLEQLIHFIETFIRKEDFNEEALETVLPLWIKHYIDSHDDQPLKDYLQRYGKPAIVDKNGVLTDKGQEALYQITRGDNGIIPKTKAISPPFSVGDLDKKPPLQIITQFLPAPHITSQLMTFVAGHGSHVFGIINAQKTSEFGGGINGIAPQANTFMIKAFQDNGVSDKSTLIAGFKKAVIHNADIVNLSLKIANRLDISEQASQLLERVLGLAPYVVCASGNDGDPNSSQYPGVVESYPARFAAVAFDVGAFDRDGQVPAFSQYEPDIGPLVLSPGFNILSTGIIPNQKENSLYTFMSGTSMATALTSGFLALILGEFKESFSRDQILKICYSSTMSLLDTPQWHKKSLLGVIDMRMALFVAHVLAFLKRNPPLNTSFMDFFDNLLAAIVFILFSLPNEYALKHNLDTVFQDNFIEYQQKIKTIEQKDYALFLPSGDGGIDVEKAVSWLANIIVSAFEQKPAPVSQKVLDKVKEILAEKNINIFGRFSATIERRIRAHNNVDSYWAERVKSSRESLIKEDRLFSQETKKS